MLITDPLFYAAAVPAVLLTGISKGGFGGALGGVAVPLMALAVSPLQAAAVMLPILCLMDVVGFRAYFRKWDTDNLKIMLPGALAGIAIGALTFGMLSESAIRLLIGGLAIAFPINNWLGLAAKQHAAGRSVGKGMFWCALSGLTSFIAHAGGPPVMVYMLPQRMDKVRYVATISVFFAFVNAAKLAPYAWLGQFSQDNLATSLVLAPLVPIGVYFGMWLQDKVNTVWFYRIAQAGLLVTGMQLIYKDIGHLF
ncbi:sulfite exporter TauE/SafE family protein [Pseudoduganella ginsengisoli]|uniref:Probable membrane transporter protein n=1 Tax=Pseudoduganella ginsengisoli TaxID=1462440 RepID=A0A6L6PY09_9BURK|nr:sulfite exporter TauE/SafE family protein [Pseudoduganella ginsengisoli]MTW01582.1 TSUP family transporter [Pseudoduganella ginsengisoli]